MDEREAFYERVIREWIPDTSARVLVCGGGSLDHTVFVRLGYRNVTISNLDNRMGGDAFAPLAWAEADAGRLPFPDDSFDYCVIHAAVHHVSSPHSVLTEMYRVSRGCLIAFESRDSWMMRRLENWEVTQVYEHSAVHFNDGRYGGVNNTEIPNFVYRWTEREVQKTISAYAPHVVNGFEFRYGTAFPVIPSTERRGRMKYLLLQAARPLFRVFTLMFPRQQNQFAFLVRKGRVPADLHPWLCQKDGQVRFNTDWGRQRYRGQLGPPPEP